MKLRTLAALALALFALASAAPAAAQSMDVDLTAEDGTMLKATYTSPGQPGPAMLLVHQCNMDRTSWDGIAGQLVEAGVHVLALDLRGFGDSQGEPLTGREAFQNLMMKSPGDVDLAYGYLVGQEGVDGSRVAVGGASCGAMLTADMTARHEGITSLMMLSGPPSDAAIAHIAATPGLGVFGAAASGDTITPGVADRISQAVDGSGHEKSLAKVYDGTEHGLPMFEANPDLEPLLIAWLKYQLLGDSN